MKIMVKYFEITIKKLNKYDDLAFNPDGDNYKYRWEHTGGLGFLNPSVGLGHTVEDCQRQVESQF